MLVDAFEEIENRFYGRHLSPLSPSIIVRPGFDEPAQAFQRGIPLLGDGVEVTAGIFKTPLIQLPDAFAALPGAAYQTRSLHDPQVFGDGLPGNLGAVGEPGDGEGSVLAEAGDELETRLITQRCEEGG